MARSFFGFLLLGAAFLGAAPASPPSLAPTARPAAPVAKEARVQVHYLEIVTPDVDSTCAALAAIHGVKFSAPVPEFGAARTAPTADGGRIGVRGPMRDTETPVVRPYLRVKDIKKAAAAAEAAGATIAIPPMEIAGQGMFSIYVHGGIEHGLWQPE